MKNLISKKNCIRHVLWLKHVCMYKLIFTGLFLKKKICKVILVAVKILISVLIYLNIKHFPTV